jgi:hypothetical protein
MSVDDVLLQNLEIGVGGIASAAVYAPRAISMLERSATAICDSGKGSFRLMRAAVDAACWNRLAVFLSATSLPSVSKFETYRVEIDGVAEQVQLPFQEFYLKDYSDRVVTVRPIQTAHGHKLAGYHFLTERCYFESTLDDYQLSLTALVDDVASDSLNGALTDRLYQEGFCGKVCSMVGKGVSTIGAGWVLLFGVETTIQCVTATAKTNLTFAALVKATTLCSAFWPVTTVCAVAFLLWVCASTV